MNLRAVLETRLSAALAAAGAPAGPDGKPSPAMVTPSSKPQFGDYQANGVMQAAKALHTNPRQLAQKVLELATTDLADFAEKIEIAGPGFLNITLKNEFVESRLAELAGDERLGVEKPANPQTVVVDYSGPNLAKEMHVGHLRSTIIGDALARVLTLAGENVVRQNHVGDWGTQFGMLLAHMEEIGAGSANLSDLEEFYRQAKKRFDGNPAFAEKARQTVVRLQAGDAKCFQAWKSFLAASLGHCRDVYRRLGVLLTSDDVHGESAYNDDLPNVVADLDKAGLLKESQGAQCVFLDEFKDADGNVVPVIVQKSDGGYLYATTDLAAIRYRTRTLHANRVLYVTDSRQGLHFKQIFTLARKAGFAPADVSLEHVPFGMMLGEDHRPFKTRTGGTVKLADLLDEAQQRAFDLVSAKSPDAPEDRRREIARVVGIGAVKYADLSQNLASDYVFSWDKMLSMDGNTAPYMQYAYARIRSIFRKGAEGAEDQGPRSEGPASRERERADESERERADEFATRDSRSAILLAEPAERLLALKLLQFPETVAVVAAECLPSVLCAYLYDLAGAFMGFYEACPVLKAAPEIRASRLALCELAARTIRTGLDLLGIQTLEQM